MRKITHQGSANQNYNELSPHTCWSGYYQNDMIELATDSGVASQTPLGLVLADS